ncbi:MAG: ABC transporter permease [Candidatus Dormibacteraeota bacterium]|nr:ABC transporter permease [Candidatus Dormibacteraeota bacterium]
MLRYVVRRLLIIPPQLLGITLVTFFIIRLVPGNPARAQLGQFASQDAVQRLSAYLGLTRPLPEQFLIYLKNVVHGDLGQSWYTSQPVTADLLVRFPSTLELITVGFLGSLVVAIPLGVLISLRGAGPFGRLAERFSFGYGLMAGAIPDFWFALILVFVFFHLLGVVSAPVGQLDLSVDAPPRITGMLLLDSLLTTRWDAFLSAAGHLILPVATLVFVNAAPVLRMTRSSIANVMGSDFIRFSRANGLPDGVIIRYALKNALLPIITLSGVLYTILLSGAVLTETIFSWGGIGQYAVQSVVNADWFPLQAVVLLTATFSLLVFLVLDLLYAVVDPRIKY